MTTVSGPASIPEDEVSESSLLEGEAAGAATLGAVEAFFFFWRAGRPPGASNVRLPDSASEVAAGRRGRAGPNGSGEGKRRGRRRGSLGDRRSRGEGG